MLTPTPTPMSVPVAASAIRVPGNPAFRFLAAFPIACFSCALLTDVAYAVTANMLWADFSAWLLAAGMGLGVLAAIAGLAGLAAGRRARAELGLPRRPVGIIAIGSLLVLALGLLNNLVHSRDAWTSVMPEGLALSAITVLVILVTVWLGSRATYTATLLTPYPGARV